MYGGRRLPSTFIVHTKLVLRLSLLSLVLIAILAACQGPPQAEVAASVIGGPTPFKVRFTNNSQNADDFQWDFGDGSTTITTPVEEPVTHEYTKAGTHTITLKAIQKGEPPQTSTATLVITVEPGPLSKVVLDTVKITTTPEEEHTFSTETLDQFDNPIAGLTLVFGAENQSGSIDSAGLFTAGTKAGTYQDAVTVEVSQAGVTKKAAVAVTIEPVPWTMSPSSRPWQLLRSPMSWASPLWPLTGSTTPYQT